jgi:hypothetical protein
MQSGQAANPCKQLELVSLNPIRVETALSRYPVHKLARKGNVAIDVKEEGKQPPPLKWGGFAKSLGLPDRRKKGRQPIPKK